jgi:ABC-type glycerol-3-phosphate transport system substrate-binding protein
MKLRSVGLVLLAVGLAACAGSGQGLVPSTQLPESGAPVATAQSMGERTPIRFAAVDSDRVIYEQRIATFEELNPDLHVEMVSADALLGIGPAGGSEAERSLYHTADVVAINPTRHAVRRGLVRDLAPLMAADATFDAADFYPNLVDAYRWSGGTWALPLSANYQLIYYDRNAFDRAHVAYPQPGWTWGEFLDRARALTVRQGDEVTSWGLVQAWPHPRSFVEGRAGPLVDYTANPPRPRFDTPEVAGAVRWYADLYLAASVTPFLSPQPGAATAAVSQGELFIERGQAAMWTALAGTQAPIQGVGNPGVAPYPVAERAGRGTTPFWPGGVAMSAGTANPQAAWRWLVFLTYQSPVDGSAGLAALPGRRSVAQSSGFWDGLDADLAAALRYAVDHSLPWHPDDAGEQALGEALDAILDEGTPVAEALSAAQAKAAAELEMATARDAPEPGFVVALPAEDVGPGAVEITFLASGGAPALESYRDLATLFKEDHPDITVNVALPTLGQQSVSGLAAGADCFESLATLPRTGEPVAILGLDPLVDADLAFPMDDFYPQLLDAFRAGGQLWGLPAGTTPYLLEYNKDLFDAAAVDYPAPGWSTDDFLAAAVALTKGEGENRQYGFVGQVDEALDLVLMLGRFGAHPIDDRVDPPAFAFDDPATVRAVAWYAALATEYGVKPVFATRLGEPAARADFVERDALMNAGRAAMWTSYGPNTDFVERAGMNLGVAPLPAAPGGSAGSGYLRTSGYYISASTSHPQACWQWITFLTGQPGSADRLPARRSVAESDAYRRLAGDERAAAYIASVGQAGAPVFQPFGGDPWLSPSFYWLFRSYGQVLAGESSAEQALQEVQQLADDYRACVVERDAFEEPKAWQSCLAQADPTLPASLFQGTN